MSTEPRCARSALYRAEVHAEQARAQLGAIVLVRPLSASVGTATAVAILAIVMAFLVTAQYTRKATLGGTLVPASGAIRIASPQPGLVQERRVREGERVQAGQPLLRLVDPRATSQDGAVAPAAIALLGRRIGDIQRQRDETRIAAGLEAASTAQRIAGLEAELAQLDLELEAIGAREALARQALERAQALERRGFLPAAQRQQAQEAALDLRSRRYAALRTRLSLARDLASLESAVGEARARSHAQLAALDAQVAALAQERVELRARGEAVVTAPESGIVAAVLVEPGQLVPGGAALFTLLPEGSPLEAHLAVPTRAAGFLREGQEVLLRYPAFPYQKFGAHRAHVVSVSRSAVAASELGFVPPDVAREPLYRVRAALDSQTVMTYGEAARLQAGMLVDADVLLDRRRLIEWVFEPLYSLAGRA